MKRFLMKLVMALALIWTLIVPATSFANGYSDYRGTDYSSSHAWNTRHHHRTHVRNHYYYRPYRHYNSYYRHSYYPYYYSHYPYYYPYYYPGFSLNYRF